MAPIEKELIELVPGLKDGMPTDDGMEQIIVHIKNLEEMVRLYQERSQIIFQIMDKADSLPLIKLLANQKNITLKENA